MERGILEESGEVVIRIVIHETHWRDPGIHGQSPVVNSQDKYDINAQ
jgi:hypothetical protein